MPARSAAMYVHQLQKKATILGSNSAGAAAAPLSVSGIREHSPDLLVDLLVLEEVLPRRPGRADRHARPAPLAQDLVDLRLPLLRVHRDRVVGAHRHARLAAGAVLRDDVGG